MMNDSDTQRFIGVRHTPDYIHPGSSFIGQIGCYTVYQVEDQGNHRIDIHDQHGKHTYTIPEAIALSAMLSKALNNGQ